MLGKRVSSGSSAADRSQIFKLTHGFHFFIVYQSGFCKVSVPHYRSLQPGYKHLLLFEMQQI